MKKLFIPVFIVAGVLFISVLSYAQEKIPVKLEVQNAQNDVVGKRLTYLITQGINTSDSLKSTGEEGFMLICSILTVKIHGRPSCAYSFIVYSNTYGKVSPVLGHHLGICSNITVDDAARHIIKNLQESAEKFSASLKKSGE